MSKYTNKEYDRQWNGHRYLDECTEKKVQQRVARGNGLHDEREKVEGLKNLRIQEQTTK